MAGADSSDLRSFTVEFSEDSGARRRLLMMEVAIEAAAAAAAGVGKRTGNDSSSVAAIGSVEPGHEAARASLGRVRGGQRRLLGTATVTFVVVAQLDVLGYASADTFEAALSAELETTIEDGTFTASYAVKESYV